MGTDAEFLTRIRPWCNCWMCQNTFWIALAGLFVVLAIRFLAYLAVRSYEAPVLRPRVGSTRHGSRKLESKEEEDDAH